MTISDLAAPGAVFFDADAFAELRVDALAYAAAVRRLAIEGPDGDTWEMMLALGFDYDDVQWHIDNPGKHWPQGFGHFG